ncbi:MAG: alpha/beta hydrolase [Anaerolineae bacterium]|nr:alpha/beta hydrolase [Anaerolineae bacterium]
MPEIDIGGRPIIYDVQGTGEPIVFLHAGLADRHMWDAQLAHFSASHRVIRYDQPGFGESPLPDDSVSYVDDLRQVMDTLGIDKATLVGCSLGGMVSLEFAVNYPERVSRLVLVGSSIVGYKPSAPLPELWEKARQAYENKDYAGVTEIGVQLFVVGRGRASEDVPDDLKAYVYKHYYASNFGQNARPEITWPVRSAVEHLSEIDVPTLVIVGSLDTEQIIEMANLLASSIPNAQKAMMENTAHLPNMEQPDAFNEMLEEFFSQR